MSKIEFLLLLYSEFMKNHKWNIISTYNDMYNKYPKE